METGASPPSIRLTPHLMFGLLIILLGIVFTLDNLNITDSGRFLRWWPLGLIAIGAAKLWQVRHGYGGALGGVLFVIAGVWLLLDSFYVVEINLFDFWPVVLIAAGSIIVWQGIRGRQHRDIAREEDTINAVAVLAGVNRGSSSAAFRGGELTAFMGGCEIDLRQASINGEATIDIFAMWGGIDIRVPEDWVVIGRVTPVMGGYEDTTRPPQGLAAHKLIIRGVVLMGGIEVRN